MKKLIILCLVAAISVPFYGQNMSESGKTLEKGDNSVNIYYGLSISKALYKAMASNSAIGLTFSSLGPVGLVYEHMVTDAVGLGAEFGYSQVKMKWTEEEFIQGSNYSYDYTFTNLRIMMRANFHFANSDNFDAYGLLSAGYRRTTFDFTTNNPGGGGVAWGGIIPFGVKPGIGLRYFFTNNIGIHIELAAGTPVICGGLSFKF